MANEKRYITYDEAVSLLPDGDYVHTFYNQPWGLMGADWNKEEILEKLRKSDFIELTGAQARAMNHGMCAYNKNTKWQSEVLFIETDADRLAKMDGDGNG